MAFIGRACIQAEIRRLLPNADLATTSTSTLRAKIEESLGLPPGALYLRKDELNNIMKMEMANFLWFPSKNPNKKEAEEQRDKETTWRRSRKTCFTPEKVSRPFKTTRRRREAEKACTPLKVSRVLKIKGRGNEDQSNRG